MFLSKELVKALIEAAEALKQPPRIEVTTTFRSEDWRILQEIANELKLIRSELVRRG